jgi:hypothetical protein
VLLGLALATAVPQISQADGPLSVVTNVRLASKAHGVALQDDFAYVATEAGLTILDVADPASPAIVGVLPASTLWRSQAIAVAGDYAYLAGQSAGLIVVDVSNPAAPTVVGRRAVPGGLWDVAVKGSVAYGASFAGELYVINVANKAAPQIAKVIGLPAWVSASQDEYYLNRLRTGVTAGNAKLTGVSVEGDSLFLAEWGYGRLYYYDVTNPLQPTFAGTHYAPYLIKAYADLDRDVVYMLSAYGSVSGLRSVPISILSPLSSTRYTSCPSCGYLKSLRAIDQGDLAIAGNGYVVYAGGKGAGEFHVVDTADDTAMLDVASDDIGLHGVGMAQGMGLRTRGNHVFQAAGALGLQIYLFPGLSE